MIRHNAAATTPRAAALCLVAAFAAVLLSAPARADNAPPNMNVALMENTFKIEGPAIGTPGASIGTGFIVVRPYPSDPAHGAMVLVTAAHVLNGIGGSVAALIGRGVDSGGRWKKMPVPIQIRNPDGTPAWTQHPTEDVAVMYLYLPDDAKPPHGSVSFDQFATDETLRRDEIGPGDELNALGYPLAAESSDAGFPILRSGKVASYPLLPTGDTKTFLLDFEVYKGNSGGPVYLTTSVRSSNGGIAFGTYFSLVGLVSQEESVTEKFVELYGRREQTYPLKLARIVHARFIKEAVEMLPAPSAPPAA